MVFFLLACADPPALKEPQTTQGWEMGDLQPCENPVDIGWTEVPLATERFAIPPNEEAGPLEPGAVVWWPEARGLQILSGSPSIEILQQRLGQQNIEHIQGYSPVQAFLYSDMDADGVLDLITAENGLRLRYSFGQSSETLQVLSEEMHTRGINVGDVDKDGDLDIISEPSTVEAPFAPYILMRNQGERIFTSETMVIDPSFLGLFFDTRLVDIDEDGDLDLLTCYDRGNEVAPNGILENDGMGNFQVATEDHGLAVPSHCMGLAFGDINQDGHLDEHIADASHNWLLVSSEDGYYDIGTAVGLPDFGTHEMVWGNAIVDIDNDGYTDIVANMGDFYMTGSVSQPLTIYQQQADGQFRTWAPLPQAASGRGLVLQDENGDGVLDMLLGQGFQTPQLFVSNGCSVDNWLEVAAPTGSTVRIWTDGKVQAALASVEHSWRSSGPSVVHFGLGATEMVDQVEISLPGGDKATLAGPISARQRLIWH